jgi:hypothetical protein
MLVTSCLLIVMALRIHLLVGISVAQCVQSTKLLEQIICSLSALSLLLLLLLLLLLPPSGSAAVATTSVPGAGSLRHCQRPPREHQYIDIFVFVVVVKQLLSPAS